MKNIINRNSKGEYHGYQEWYWKDNTLVVRLNYKNGNEIGYEELHVLKKTRYYIK
jgi:hypothetical protein